jgi:hypothetical protein
MLNIKLNTMTGSTYKHKYMCTLYTLQIQNLAKVKTGCGKKT